MPAADTTAGTHILVFPFPAQGHILPLLDLASQLSLSGLKLTVLVTPNNLPILTPLLSSHPSISALVLPFPRHPDLPAGVENIRDIGNHGILSMLAALSDLAGPISDWFRTHPSPPRAILSDFFLGWTQNLARQLGIPRIAFFSSGCFLSAVNAVLFSDVEEFKGLDFVEFTDLPRSPAFKEEHLPSMFRSHKKSHPYWPIFADDYHSNSSNWGCVFNSFHALEGDYMEYFKNLSGHGRIYGVGPLNLLGSLDRVNPDKDTRHEVIDWLDKCPEGSVLYVSFGSQKWLTAPQLQTLGLALEKSGVRFVWAVRAKPDDWSALDGFEQRVAGRGFVYKGWAPQVEILGHGAVGGFLSHCGWNSVLESVVAGVVILAWPMEADQFVNTRLLVEEMGVAVRTCEGPDTVPNPDELGRVIASAMREDATQRLSARELREKALAAVEGGGTSVEDFREFVKELDRI